LSITGQIEAKYWYVSRLTDTVTGNIAMTDKAGEMEINDEGVTSVVSPLPVISESGWAETGTYLGPTYVLQQNLLPGACTYILSDSDDGSTHLAIVCFLEFVHTNSPRANDIPAL
jgi:hypothetical protein